ncbi:MAG: hypothetical protein DRI97_00030 [Bacteroidetes bacterium]|nr:MAG: hypothetical protein DRI97_00030 [Bacteroidota bacterium]
MNYETESALRQKADKHELHQLQRDNESLRGEVRELENKVGRVGSNESYLREMVVRLIELLSERMEGELFSELQSLRMSL